MTDLGTTTACMSLLADRTRVRLLVVLEDMELTVSELTRVTGLVQSRVSTHLGRLREAGMVADRKVGPSTFYRVNPAMSAAMSQLWAWVRDQVDDGILVADLERRDVIVQSRGGATAWPDLVAGQMEHHYSPGRTWEAVARGFLGLLRLGDVLDVGSGDGVIAGLLAGRAQSITCLDRSERVIAAAKTRLRHLPHVRFDVGDMHQMPLPDAAFDQLLLFNVLTYADDPAQVLSEASRVLRSGGVVCVATLADHGHSDVASAYQHVNQGFTPDRLRELLDGAGFDIAVCERTSRERRQPFFEVVTAFGHRRCLAQDGQRVLPES